MSAPANWVSWLSHRTPTTRWRYRLALRRSTRSKVSTTPTPGVKSRPLPKALEAAAAKLEAAAARLALILALAREPKAQEVDFASMAAGILLAEWFAHEAERVYGMAGKSTQRR